MADQADRERESRESDTTKFEDIRREDEAERERAVEEVARQRLQDEDEQQDEP